MSLRTPRQRPGRLFHWVTGVLLVVLVGITGYQWWIGRDRQEQDDEAVARARDAAKSRVEYKGANPDDWPQWRGPQRDGVAPGKDLIESWPAGGPPVVWRQDAPGGFSAPSVADGRLVMLVQDGDDEVVVCRDAETGEQRWRFPYPAKFTTKEGSGPRSSPVIDGIRVYTVGAEGHLHCLNAITGEVDWKKNLCEEFGAPPLKWGVSFSPLVLGDLLITTPGGKGSGVVAFDKATGKVRWQALDDRPSYSSPVFTTAAGVPQIICFMDDAVVSVDPSGGNLYWRYPFANPQKINAATPIVLGDYVFVSSGYARGCALLEVFKKEGKPEVRYVYTFNKMRNQFGSSVVHQDHVYGFDEGRLACMSFSKGKPRLWDEPKFKRGSLILAGDDLIVLGEDGELALVGATPKGYREKSSFRLTEDRCWTAPVLARGRLYVRDEKEIVCLDLRKK